MSAAPPAKRARSDDPADGNDGDCDDVDVPMPESGPPERVKQGPRFFALVWECLQLNADYLALSEVFQPNAFVEALRLGGMKHAACTVRADSTPRKFDPPGPSMYQLMACRGDEMGKVINGRFKDSSQGFMINNRVVIRGVPVCVASAHLKAGPPEKGGKLREKQCRQIDAEIMNAVKEVPDVPVAFFIGDMNAELHEDAMQTLTGELGWKVMTLPNAKTSYSKRKTQRKGEKADAKPQEKCKAADHIFSKILVEGWEIEQVAALGMPNAYAKEPTMACHATDHLPVCVEFNVKAPNGTKTLIRLGGLNVFGYPLADQGEVVGHVAPCIDPGFKDLASELIQKAKPKRVEFDIGAPAGDIVKAPWGLDPEINSYETLITKCTDAVHALTEFEATKTKRSISEVAADVDQEWWKWNPEAQKYEPVDWKKVSETKDEKGGAAAP